NGPIILGEVLQQEGDRILRWRSRTTLDDLKRGKSHTILAGEKQVPLPDGRGLTDQGDGSVYNGDYPASSSRVAGPGFGLARSTSEPARRNFGSAHPGVCLFLFADVSARPLAN